LGTNNEGFKKKLEFKGAYFTTHPQCSTKQNYYIYSVFFVQTEIEWWKNEKPLLLNILAMKDSMVGWGRIPHEHKKELSFALEVTNLCVKQWNVNYQGLTKNPH
jgi:hypothetical protein